MRKALDKCLTILTPRPRMGVHAVNCGKSVDWVLGRNAVVRRIAQHAERVAEVQLQLPNLGRDRYWQGTVGQPDPRFRHARGPTVHARSIAPR